MSTSSAETFIAKLENDQAFAERLAALSNDPSAVQAALADAGIDATPEEIREAVLEHLGSQLTEEELAVVAGGMSDAYIGLFAAGGVAIVASAAAIAAAA